MWTLADVAAATQRQLSTSKYLNCFSNIDCRSSNNSNGWQIGPTTSTTWTIQMWSNFILSRSYVKMSIITTKTTSPPVLTCRIFHISVFIAIIFDRPHEYNETASCSIWCRQKDGINAVINSRQTFIKCVDSNKPSSNPVKRVKSVDKIFFENENRNCLFVGFIDGLNGLLSRRAYT